MKWLRRKNGRIGAIFAFKNLCVGIALFHFFIRDRCERRLRRVCLRQCAKLVRLCRKACRREKLNDQQDRQRH